MSNSILYGIVEFTTPLFCAADALGQVVNISIGGHSGKLILPSLPDWWESEENPLNNSQLNKSLLGPEPARNWRKGEKPIFWGILNFYPSGDASVKLALMEFSLEQENIESAAQQIYECFGEWLDLFEKYMTLFTTQNTHNLVSGEQRPVQIELLTSGIKGFKHIFRAKPQVISIVIPSNNDVLHLEQLRNASRLSSQQLSPRFEYQLLLEAYSARKIKDYRKAIIEAANALEICLTARIIEEFDNQRISFGEKLLQKFRMLGGRFELIKLLGIPHPNKDYESLVSKPRNNVVHRGSFPDKVLTDKVIAEVEELLRLFSPQVHQDTTAV